MVGFEVVPVRELPDSSRCQELINTFTNIYKNKPSFCVRVPGRVNLIGEHIDYCGYSVCPMALDQDVLIAVSVQNDKKLQLHNIDTKYKEFECDIDNFEISLGKELRNGISISYVASKEFLTFYQMKLQQKA
ncbi:unnamed protein product [Diabrotica balteata]|uniref:Galactokinase N-terminal domain-containing protein n=1 Tax=Diabrotica balteata TaxID=107213 RepID=A0A9N9TCL0_DIABA|nr:unnamed protein product [Diabrotica balteata]